ncbi:hypothetical protein MPL3356_220229 [Mesorhizobium plurifarium]|uniref:Uncharacterized protein n=1 Tax=Mesorhizobium plurifarium TaxID=69974 RepID=A0A090G273_MESPL|nr:hypothetical protein MPL3356_220229 [Mesorhizobium plurifarium]CDX50682.1 hypothetical protein MPL3365_130088 [Mesorhizobium plurifarium]
MGQIASAGDLLSPGPIAYGSRQAAQGSASGTGLVLVEKFGAACVTRTRDPIITNDVLYQLS